MKFRIKNCPECTWWNSPERFEPQEFCVLHTDKEDQPPGIIKAIKEVKKERWENRMICWIFALILFFFAACCFISLFTEQKKWEAIVDSAILTTYLIFLPSAIREIVDNEKDTQAKLKKLQKKHSEWIIE